MNTPTACPLNPADPSLIGSSPTVYASGAVTGAASRSAGRTHSPQAAQAGRKSTL
ncbi:hypothetical protein SMF913_28633 [Streptomyces malaysiensis]|uniref:Uncharacterized protein n=1 Tax=Streptomyces malaysiensis TaxID=92644 RepID=A0A2J7YYS5_STRMQ|nr:hypothetical protein SMF913_28633 [Streptomyces malaysiensis]